MEAALAVLPQLTSLSGVFTDISSASVINSIALLAVVISLRFFLIRRIRQRAVILSKDQRRWINRVRVVSFITILIGISVIWAPHLHTFALSLAAFAVALVIATKEMILCLMGSLVRVTTHPFRIGDWITVDGETGEVIDINAFSTVIQEVSTKNNSFYFTGRTVQIPNGKYFTSNIENSNYLKDFIYTDFTIPFYPGEASVDELADALTLIADRYYSPFREQSYAFRRKAENKALISIPDPEPHIFTQKPAADSVAFKVRAFVPTSEAETFAHRVTRDFTDRLRDIKNSGLPDEVQQENVATGIKNKKTKKRA